MDESSVTSNEQDDATIKKEISESVVFKIPAIAKKTSTKKEKPSKKMQSGSDQSSAANTPTDQSSVVNSSEKRPLVSFQPKSLILPSQVYKPHRPSTSEYIEHYYKLEKEGKQQRLSSTNTKIMTDESENKETKSEEVTKVKSSAKTKLNYIKPEWSCLCEADASSSYCLEVLKSGSIIDKIDLVGKEYFIFGRLSDCDITLDHPSISRYHAVLQFGRPTDNDEVEFQKDGSAGFYLYDLGSTHGTYLNKVQAPSKKYYRVKVGHMMKFGGSSRMYIVQGPHDDEEEEAKETPTELKEKARAVRNKKDLAKMMMGDDSDDGEDEDSEEKHLSSIKDSDTDTGITWGMLEDAVMESDEDDENEAANENKEIIFSLEDKKEPFYVKDPHKALKNFYDKEGIEIDFECTERRPGQWYVRLELPIDTPSGKPVVAEASITGKRKDAMNNCALEACRLLDKHGMFKQSEHHRRKVKEWEKEDFYDSDEDQYWDRTGELEEKRRLRKQRIGVKTKTTDDVPQTYESLKKQIDELEKEISQIEEQLEKDKKAIRTNEGSSDPLEEFMKQVKSGKTLDSITRSKLKQRLFAIKKESARLTKLADVARPSSLPPLANQASKSMSFIGRMKGKKKNLSASNKPLLPPPPTYQPLPTDDNIVEEEEDDIETSSSKNIPATDDKKIDIEENAQKAEDPVTNGNKATKDDSLKGDMTSSSAQSPTSQNRNGVDKNSDKNIKSETVTTEPLSPSSSDVKTNRKRMFGPTLPQDLKERLISGGSTTDESVKNKKKHRKKSSSDSSMIVQTSNDPTFADWLPPENQSGDGTTSLNAKYGY